MKLGIFCNYVYPSIGGSEIVIHNIAKKMIVNYHFNVSVFGCNIITHQNIDNVDIFPCKRKKAILEQINKMDHIFIYSDSFWEWDTILDNIEDIKPKITIALVGMYHMIENNESLQKMKKHLDKIKVITHSRYYQDYKKCFQEKIPVNVIFNGVDLEEIDNFRLVPSFKEKYGIDFKEKYGINKESKIILNVSNFFYGKGQIFLPDIIESYVSQRASQDVTLVSISSTIKYPYDKTFLNETKRKMEIKSKKRPASKIKEKPYFDFGYRGFKYKFLRDIPRDDILAAFAISSVFVFPSQKEVSPLVILEAMAMQIPWVSMDVGNVQYLHGGSIIYNDNIDTKGYKKYNDTIIQEFGKSIYSFISDIDYKIEAGDLGRSQIEDKYDWNNICEEYYNLFIS